MERKEAKYMKDISESLFQAVDIIMSAKLHDLKYDKTITCTIEDDTNKEKGEYICSDGSSKFIAYSDVTTYKNGISVYVTVPDGDYNNRKIIIGRYVEDNGEYYTYRAPFEDYIDITENLIEDDLPATGLLANGSIKEKVLWMRDFEKERDASGDENYVGIGKGYKVLGLNAKFKSWLAALAPVVGSYGLRIDLVGRQTNTAKTEATEKYYSFYLTTDDMFGNVYNFETYYSQEKIFDISMIDEIARMQLVFYQDANFATAAGTPIPTTQGNIPLTDNIFVKEPFVSLGYSLSDFAEDALLLYSFDSLTYTPQASSEQNTKRLKARWIHFDEEGQVIAIDKENEIPADAKLHWYKFNLTEGVTDTLAGNFWEELPDQLNKLSYKFVPDISKQNEKYKIIVETPNLELIQTEIDDGLTELEAKRDEYKTEEDFEKAKTEFELQQLARVNYYYSEVFTFENEVACVNDATVDLIQALQIVCDPKEDGGLQGNYCIYDMTNELLNPTEGKKVRKLEATYKSLVTGEPSLDKAASITWKIPISNTMIYPPEEGVEYFTKVDEESGAVPDEISGDGNFFYITRMGTENYDLTPEEEAEGLQIEVLQNFRIKSYYTQSATNNTIYCSVVKNNRTYEASVSLAFGPMGTNGTDSTLILSLDKNAAAIKPGETLNVNANLYDYENNELEITDITWSWWSYDNNIELTNTRNNPCTIKASATEGIKIYHNILKAVVKHNDIMLEAYLPIPVKSSDNVKYAELPNRVVYDAGGSNAAYYKNPLRVIKAADDAQFDGFWDIILTDYTEANRKYYPVVKETEDGVKFVPTSMFFNDLDKGVTLIFETADMKEWWYQPILIIQNRWPSAMLNSWDGSLTIDEENGTILSTMVGAGKKESDNTFTGVLMGDVETGSGDKTIKKTGVYGYNHGMQSFGFMDDGKAFIGKTGKGRIEFDGNHGWIQSMSYSLNKTGMRIDLDDGIIDIRGAKKLTENNTNTSNSTYKETNSQITIQALDPYLIIKTENAKEIMRIGSEKYYLQSEDFTDKVGAKLDIAKGIFQAYDVDGSGNYIKLSGNGSPFFQIHDAAKSINIMYAGESQFYLQSSNYKDKQGMKIDLNNGTLTTYDNEGSGSYVKIDGGGAPFLAIYDAEATTTSKYILYASKSSYYMQSSDYVADTAGVYINFKTGYINSYKGSIGGWDIYPNYLKGGTVTLNKDGTISGGTTYKWSITSDGEANFDYLHAESGGQIGPFKVNATCLYTGSPTLGSSGVYLGNDGLSVGTSFSAVASSGTVTCTKLIAKKEGQIGPFNISASGLSTAAASTYSLRARAAGGTVDLTSTGISVNGDSFSADTAGNVNLKGVIAGNLWSIDADGLAKFENLQVTKKGKFGPLLVDGTKITADTGLILELNQGSSSLYLSDTMAKLAGPTGYVAFLSDTAFIYADRLLLKQNAIFEANGNFTIECTGTINFDAGKVDFKEGGLTIAGEPGISATQLIRTSVLGPRAKFRFVNGILVEVDKNAETADGDESVGSLATQTWVTENFAAKSHSHSGYASSSHSHSQYCTADEVEDMINAALK